MKPGKTRLGNPILWCGVALGVAAIVFAAGHPFSKPPQPLTEFSGPTMGTRYMVKVVGPPCCVNRRTLEHDVREILDTIDSRMSTYRPDSELSRLNRFDRTEWFGVSRETAVVIAEAIRLGHLSGGAFDVTVGPLVNLWQFGAERRGNDRVPPPDEIDRARSQIGFAHLQVQLSPPAVRKKRENLCIDLSGLAKGFAVDQIAEHLERCGIENYLVEVGGELRAKGHNRQGRPWQVAVEAPLAGTRMIQRTVALEDLAMATSGNYRNYFEDRGVRYCHIIDPRSGRPVSHRLASVTVLASSCMRADGLATALMVLGPEAGYDLAVREKLPVLLIVKSDAGPTEFLEKPTPELSRWLH